MVTFTALYKEERYRSLSILISHSALWCSLARSFFSFFFLSFPLFFYHLKFFHTTYLVMFVPCPPHFHTHQSEHSFFLSLKASKQINKKKSPNKHTQKYSIKTNKNIQARTNKIKNTQTQKNEIKILKILLSSI